MSKEIIDPNSIRANTPDWQEGYDQGLLAGYAKSIVLIRSLQRSDRRSLELAVVREVLEQAMELIANKIEPNTNEVD